MIPPSAAFEIVFWRKVISTRVDAGYAARGVAGAMRRLSWAEAARLAADLDPLVPAGGRLAFVSAVERLPRRGPSLTVEAMRDVALALDRAQKHLSWLVRGAAVLAYDDLAAHAARLGSTLNLRHLGTSYPPDRLRVASARR